MKWVTRQKAKVDRIACPWLITHFVDPNAEFLYVPADQVNEIAKREDAIPYDAAGVELTHYRENGEERGSFDAIIKKYRLKDPALLDLAEIVRTADAGKVPHPRPEGAGLEAAALGFRQVAKDDHEPIPASTGSFSIRPRPWRTYATPRCPRPSGIAVSASPVNSKSVHSNPRAESARARLPTTGRSTTVVVIGIASPASLIWTEVTGAWVCQGRRRTIESHRAARPSCVGCIVSSWRISWWAVTRRTEPGRKTVCCPAPSS